MCAHPFFECVEVYEHPTLYVAVCYYCHRAISAALNVTREEEATSATGQPEQPVKSDDDCCSWCFQLNGDDDDVELFGCDEDG